MPKKSDREKGLKLEQKALDKIPKCKVIYGGEFCDYPPSSRLHDADSCDNRAHEFSLTTKDIG